MVLTGKDNQIYNKKYYEAKNKTILNKDVIFGYVKTLYKNKTINDNDIKFLKDNFEIWADNSELNENIDNVFICVLKDTGFKKIGCDNFNSKICSYMLTYNSNYLKELNVRLIEYVCSIYRFKGLSNLMIYKYQKLYKCSLIPNEINYVNRAYWKKYFFKNYDVNCYNELAEKVLKKLDIEYCGKYLLNNWNRIYY